MSSQKRTMRIRKWLAVAGVGTAFHALPISGCEFGEFTTTSTVTLDGEEVVDFLIRNSILTPIESTINRGVDQLFENINHDHDDD